MPEQDGNCILTGFMGTGKSSIARLVAEQLGRPFVDMDTVIAERAGKSISVIFEQDGETAFRAWEYELGCELSRQGGQVIATGGGALLNSELAHVMANSGFVICLDSDVAALLARLQNVSDRPLLAADDRAERLTALWRQRRPLYARLPLHLDTSGLSISAAASKVVSLTQRNPRALSVKGPDGIYHILLVPGAADTLADYMKAHGTSSAVLLISNETVWPLYGPPIQQQLAVAGYQPAVALVPDGEGFKTLETVRTLYEQCAAARLDRRSVIIALGGGVVTDMAGFVAATYLRGIPCIPVPTTLLAMVDASVGGKVAVDLPQGKNLVGAFAQPRQVLLDPDYLATLPQRELIGGLAEIIKAGIIGDGDLFAAFEAGALLPPWRWLIERALAVKIAVVEADPYETGQRAVLNLGHTFAHAFEVLANYALPHGLAVAVGLAAAAELAVVRGHLEPATRQRIIDVLERHHLPITWRGGSAAQVLQAMQRDKKRVDAGLVFVLPRAIGEVIIDANVRDADIERALERIIQ